MRPGYGAVDGRLLDTRRRNGGFARSRRVYRGGAGRRAADMAPCVFASPAALFNRNEQRVHHRLKPFIRTCAKFESGSGSGDQDGMISMEDGVDVAAKKRKTRRGKPKHRKLKPYSSKQQLSYQQRLRCRATGRSAKTGRQPPAPYNTTQFLMEDHNDLPDLDEKIAGATNAGCSTLGSLEMPQYSNGSHFSKPSVPPRTRDSSFSIDSDENYFYSSPEDEEEFLTKEFSSAYEDLHAERLGALTKSELIQEYIQLEAKVDLLTKRLRSRTTVSQAAENYLADRDDPENAKKIKVLQQRVDELHQQNEALRRENEALARKLQRRAAASPRSSVDSESDSSSDSSCSASNASACSCNHKTTTSPGSSPVPASYHARRDKLAPASRRKNSSVSSVVSESDDDDTTTGESSAAASPKTSAGGLAGAATGTTTTSSSSTTTTTSSGGGGGNGTSATNGAPAAAAAADAQANGRAASFEIVALPS